MDDDNSVTEWSSEMDRQLKISRLYAKLARREGEKIGALAATPVVLLAAMTVLMAALVAIEIGKAVGLAVSHR